MQQLTESDLRRIFGEIIVDELNVIHEYLEQLLPLNGKVSRLEKDMAEVKSDIKVIKAALTDQGRQMRDHETRIVGLEAMAHTYSHA